MAKRLDPRAQRFVDAYLGSANGNGTAAAKAAGYAGNANVLHVQANRLLQKATVRKVIDAREARRTGKAILAADERDLMLSDIARLTWSSTDKNTAIRAIAELNKCTGRHSIKHVLDGKLTLEQALDASRK